MMKTLFFSSIAFSVLLAERANDGAIQSLDLFDQKQRQEYIDIELEEALKQENKIDSNSILNTNSSNTYFFKEIVFEKTELNLKENVKLVKQYENKIITTQDILDIISKTSNNLIRKGYSTSVVTIKQIDKENQRLILEVKIGRINNILLNDNANDRRLKVLPMVKGDIFNIFNLDQSIENLNNASMDTTSKIQASEQYGYSDVYLNTQDQMYNLYANFDNSGQNEEYKYKSSLSYTHNNLLNLNDTINFTYSKSLPFSRKNYNERLYSTAFSIPVNNTKLSFSFSGSNTRNLINGEAGEYLRKSKIDRYKIGIKQTLTRIDKTKISAYANLNIKNNKNKIDDNLLETSSGRYSNIAIGLEATSSISRGSVFAQLEYSKGLKIFGSRGNTQDSAYNTEFNIIKALLSIQKYIYADNNFGLLLKSNFALSYSNKPLLYADKFEVGSEYTVRGFKYSSAAWDYGGYLNNTISLKLFQGHKYIKGFSPFIGLDFGYGKDYLLPKADKLIGLAYGFSYDIGNFNIKATFSKALKKSKDMPKEKPPFYLNISFSI